MNNIYNSWLVVDKAMYNRLNKLIVETARTPFEGTGKPEALKHDLKGYWSRCINDEHRLVYRGKLLYQNYRLQIALLNALMNVIRQKHSPRI